MKHTVCRVLSQCAIIFPFLCLMLALFETGKLQAQNRSTAEIVGTVTDTNGALVPKVIVKITNLKTATSKQITTNEKGDYDMPYLDPGPYTVEFQGAGYESAIRQGIDLELDQIARVDIQLKIGATSQVVTVSGDAPILDTEDSQRGTNFNNTLVEDLPTVGRDSSYLALLAPGTSTAQSSISGVDPGRRSVNGSRAFSMSATVNGGSGVLPNSDNFVTLVPALAAVGEFNVIEDNFNAEYATGTSVLNIVTKSGTNQLHGSVFEYFENNVLNARNYFAKSATPLRYNQPGGSIGGPILHDKLFFFLSYQNTINPSTTITTQTVPTAAVAGGDFTGLPTIKDPLTGQPFYQNQIPSGRIDPVAQKVLSYWPQPNEPGNVNNFYFAGPQDLQTPIYDGRIDYQINQNNSLSGAAHVYRLTDDHTGSIPGPACFNDSERCGVQVSNSQQWTITDRLILSPSRINEVRFNFTRQFFNQTTPNENQNLPETLGLTTVPQNFFPYFTISGAIPTSIGPGTHSGGAQNTFSYADNYTWIRGKHSLKFGGEYDRFQYNVLNDWQSGTFGFDGIFTNVGFADFLLGLPDSYSLDAQPNTIGARRSSFAAFAQDDFHVTSTLTLNAGLRYQGEGAFSEVQNRLSNFSPTLENPLTDTPGAIVFASAGNKTLQENHFKLLAPRVGFAWSPASAWVVRGSYGVFFVPISAQQNYNATPPGYAITQSLQVTDQSNPTPIFQLQQGPPQYSYPSAADRTPSIQNGQSVTYYPYNAPQGYMEQWQLSVERQLSSSMVAEISYVGSKGTHLLFPRDLNQVPESLLGPGNLQSSRPYPQFLSITTKFNDADSNYNALQVQLNRRFAHGLTFLANYTWSKSMDNCSLDLTTSSGCEYQNAYSPSSTYAPSQFDQTNRAVIASAYDLPFGVGRPYLNRRGITDLVLGGWTASESFSANSGAPFTVFSSLPSPALSGSLFANVNGNPKSPSPSIAQWFNVDTFSNPAPYTFGNSSRDLVRGPGFWDLDASVRKRFSLPIGTENRYHMDLRGDFYNLLNHPNFAQPNNTIGSAAAGTITAIAYSNANNNPSRQIQVGLDLNF
jgi:Carboxypeptidase regulatory-like domain/TonB dependent receptor